MKLQIRPASTDSEKKLTSFTDVRFFNSLFSIFLFILAFHTNLESQIKTSFLDSGYSIWDVSAIHIDETGPLYVTDDLDFKKYYDPANAPSNFYGIPLSLDINTEDGNFFEYGGFYIWKILVEVPDAQTIDFFIKMELPKRSSLIIYDEAESVVLGPITSHLIPKGKYSSDLLPGNRAVFEAVIPKSKVDEFNINISHVVGGINSFNNTKRAFGDALECHTGASCSEGDSWDDEKEAVCLITFRSGFTCSGFLLNSYCQYFKGYVITAYHCVNAQSCILEEEGYDEITHQEVLDGAEGASFRFDYISPTCNGIEPTSYTTFSGSEYVSGYFDSDYLLFELDAPILNKSDFHVLGWDNSSSAPSEMTMLSHPAGDVMKITHDDQSLTIAPGINDQQCEIDFSGSSYFLRGLIHDGVNGDFGVSESGSSGGPWMNSAGRVIATQHGGWNQPCGPPVIDSLWGGRFYNHWIGDGSNDTTRISAHLSEGGTPTTTNTIEVPYMSFNDKLVCDNASETFTLNGAPPGYTITWAVDNTNLFDNPTSGTGTSASLQGDSDTDNGQAVLTFTLDNPTTGCSNVTISETIWVGNPPDGDIDISHECGEEDGIIIASVSPDNQEAFFITGTTFDWTVTKNQGTGGFTTEEVGQAVIIDYWGDITSFDIDVDITNDCGTTTESITYHLSEGCGNGSPKIGPSLIIRPQPTTGKFELFINGFESPSRSTQSWNVFLYNSDGIQLKSLDFLGNNLNLDISDFHPSMYYIEVSNNEYKFVKPVILIK